MKKRRRRGGLYITPRDKKLFHYLHSNKLATALQVNKDIFRNSTIQTAYGRLRQLWKAGYLSPASVMLGDSTKRTYSLSPKGFRYLQEYCGLDVHTKQFKSDSKAHDLILVDILRVFRNLKCVSEVVCENELVCSNKYHEEDPYLSFCELESDGYCLMSVQGEEKNVAIEFERNLKSDSRIVDKMNRYSIEDDVDLILCVAIGGHSLDRLMRLDKDVYGDDYLSKMYFCTLTDVLNSKGELQFKNSSSDVLSLK